MPKRVLPLSDLKINKAKPQEKEYCLFDGGGLYLAVTPSGGKLWRIKYRFEGKNKLLHLGAYPVITLAEARQKLLDTKRTIASGVDPGAVKKAQKQSRLEKEANSFEVIAREWHGRFIDQWTEGHAVTIMSRLNRDVFPYIPGLRMKMKLPHIIPLPDQAIAILKELQPLRAVFGLGFGLVPGWCPEQ